MDDTAFRLALGETLRRARGEQPLARASRSGIGHRTIDRLEHGINGVVTFESVHRLAEYYGVALGDVFRAVETGRGALGARPADALGFEDADTVLRASLRARRQQLGLGTPAVSRTARVHQTWLVRLESGEVPVDVVRVYRIAQALRTSIAGALDISPCAEDTAVV